jgi:predicted dehydrogenase
MSEKRIRVAVVGTGGIAKQVHIPTLRVNRNVDLVALVDMDQKKATRAAKKFHVKKVFPSIDKLFENERVDAVTICTPPSSHADIALKAFNHDAHVFCEKPLAVDIESGRKMVRAAKDAGKTLMVGFHRRYIPNYQQAKRAILKGNLGHIYCVEDHFVEPNPLFGYTKSEWFLQPKVGGVLSDIAPHVFDMLNYIYDDFPNAISAISSVHLDSPVEEQCVFLLEYPKQRVGIGIVSWLSATVRESLQIYGTAQNLFASPTFFMKDSPTEIHEISLLRAAGESLMSMKFPKLFLLRTRRANPYQLEIEDFLQHIRKNQSFDSNALNAFSVLLTSDMARISMEKKCRTIIPSPTDL